MKNVVFKGILAACMLLFCFVGRAQTVSDPVGVWDYSIPSAPPEYSPGKAEFKKQNDKLILVLTAGENPALTFDVTVKDKNVYVCQFTSNEFSMTITLKPNGENLSGTLSTDMWDVEIDMKPAKKK